MKLVCWGESDVGRKRQNNEDSLVLDPVRQFFMVADGVGGGQAGEVASDMATQIVHLKMQTVHKNLEQQSLTGYEAQKYLTDQLPMAIREASEKVYVRGRHETSCRGMATTAVALQVTGTVAIVGHVGDSRVYLSRSGRMYQLTEDHTLMQELIKSGMLTPDRIADFPHKNVIARSVGSKPTVDVDILAIDLLVGDSFVLCSDGLTDMVAPEHIQRVVDALPAQQSVRRLISMANENGGIDNVTVLVINAEGDAEETQSDETMPIRMEHKVEFLQRFFLFRDLNFQETMRVLPVTRERHYYPGDVVIHEGDVGDELFVLVAGEVEVTNNGVHLTNISAGGHFGELALMGDGVRTATVTSIGRSTVLSLRKADVDRLLESDHGISVKLYRRFIEKIAARMKRLSDELSELRANQAQ